MKFLLLLLFISSAAAKSCGKNEEYRRGCDITCENPDAECRKPTKDCYCKDGYLRNSEGICVPVRECRRCSTYNEEFRRDRCEGSCTSPDLKECKPEPIYQCLCMPGYYRNNDGLCVGLDFCNCGENEVYREGCERFCVRPDGRCREILIDCFCKDGYARNDEGKCVLISDCPEKPPVCYGDNEVLRYGSCDDQCPGVNIVCLAVVQLGCFCRDGYVRDASRRCIPKNLCPSNYECSGPNEIYKSAECEPTCENPELVCLENKRPVEKCYCKYGYARRADNLCVRLEECPNPVPCSGTNEVYTYGSCDGTCEAPNSYCYAAYRPGCFCREGLVRDSENKCIPLEECPEPKTCSGKNEEYRFGGCDKSCIGNDAPCGVIDQFGCFCKKGHYRNYRGECVPKKLCEKCYGANEEYKLGTCDPNCRFPIPVCRKGLTLGCYCRDGYVRDENRICIPLSRCGGRCGKNEEYVKGCSKSCVFPTQACPVESLGCHCKDGYFRNKENKCVSSSECQSDNNCSDPNEESRYGYCDVYCDPNLKCKASYHLDCFCKQGYARSDDGKCIEFFECGTECDDNEEFNYACDATCDQPVLECPEPILGCNCKRGYVRDIFNRCVLVDECNTPCPGNNEIYRYDNCDDTCLNPNVMCRSLERIGCFCKPGYVRDDNRECIYYKDCQDPSCTGKNEEYRKDSCDGRCDFPEAKYCDLPPVYGCFCLDGYLRDDQGICVLAADCTNPVTCPPNEEYRADCPSDCQFRDVYCYVPQWGCYCIKGYLRNSKGFCVPINQCDDQKCNRPFEEYKLACQGDCQYPNIQCVTLSWGCYCEDGHLRNSYGDCVPIEKCQESNKCGKPNESYIKACQGDCDRPNIVCKTTVWGCYCDEGYLRNDQGICVPKDKCDESKCNGPNEVFTLSCDRSCRSIDIICEWPVWSCFCRDGYLRNGKGVCVPVDECEEELCKGPNEVYMRACQGDCAEPNIVCVHAPWGCYCEEGYLRNYRGVCVLQSDCYKCGKNEEFTDCLPCNPGSSCSAVCRPGCKCKDEYFRNDEFSECLPKIDCEKNSEFKLGTCNPTCSRPIPVCRKGLTWGCYCKHGYVEIDQKCQPLERCPDPNNLKCRKNEVVNQCPGYCTYDPDCESEFKGIPKQCPPMPDDYQCTPMCECIPGLVRIGRKCMSPDHCCGKNEEAVPYRGICDGTCYPTNDDRVCIKPPCPKQTCQCRRNYVRNAKGICVKKHGKNSHSHHKNHQHDSDDDIDHEIHALKFKNEKSYYENGIHLLKQLIAMLKKTCCCH